MNMSELERIGVSLDKDLLSKFDKLITKQGYKIRSEAIRDLVRKELSDDQIENPMAQAVAAVFIVYDHHSTKLSDSLVDLQHSHTLDRSMQVISSLHIHLDEHDCLEIIVLRGLAGEIKKIGENIISMRGVKLGKINIVATS
jgi:CopG family nickel-responsive transcriptional regulator